MARDALRPMMYRLVFHIFTGSTRTMGRFLEILHCNIKPYKSNCRTFQVSAHSKREGGEREGILPSKRDAYGLVQKLAMWLTLMRFVSRLNRSNHCMLRFKRDGRYISMGANMRKNCHVRKSR